MTLKTGDKVRFRIDGKKADGAVQTSMGKVFICQNLRKGADCGKEKFGYKYSWYIGKVGNVYPELAGICNVKVIVPAKKGL